MTGEVLHNENDLMLKVSVSDKGIGMSEYDQNRLFQNFFKTRNTESIRMNPYGNGIGLSLCKKICQGLDGDISVSSMPGHGSEFIFTMKAFEVYTNASTQKEQKTAKVFEEEVKTLFDASFDDLLDEDLEPLNNVQNQSNVVQF